MAKQFAKGDFRLPATGLRLAPQTRFDQAVSPHRVIEGREFPLDAFKRMRKAASGATVNDCVLAIIGGALRKYLDAKDELPTKSLVTAAPISVRAEDQKQAAGNMITAMFVALGTDITDPLERLHFVREETANSKALTHAVGARALTEFSQFIPGALVGVAARVMGQFGITEQARAINTIVTNVPGPPEPLYFARARMIKGFGLGPLFQGVGIIHPISSYCGTVIIGVTSTREFMPDPEFYAACLEASFEELSAATAAALAVGPDRES